MRTMAHLTALRQAHHRGLHGEQDDADQCYVRGLVATRITLLCRGPQSSCSGKLGFWTFLIVSLSMLLLCCLTMRFIITGFSTQSLALEALLFIYTFGLATYLSHFRRTPWMLRPIRNLMANFAVTISLVTASALAAIYSSDTNLRMLSVDADFSPNRVLSDGSKRPWIVNPAGIDRPFPAWGIGYAVLPAIGEWAQA